MAMSPDDKHLYIGEFNSMVVLDRDADDGMLSLAGIVPGSGFEFAIARAPIFTKDSAFALTADSSSFSVFQRDTVSGMLTRIQIVEQPPGIDPCGGVDVSLSPDDQFLYLSCISGGSILIYQRDVITGTFSYLERIQRYENKVGLVARGTVSPDGQFYISLESLSANSSNGLLSILHRDALTGSLTYQDTISIPSGLNRHAEFSPDGGKFLSGSAIYDYSAETGKLALSAILDDPCMGAPQICWSVFSADGGLIFAGPIRRSGEDLIGPTAGYRSGYRVQCPLTPLTGCTPADAGAITINAPDEEQKRGVKIVFETDNAALADLGDPQGITDYAVCAYDSSAGPQQLRWTATLPGGMVQCGGPAAWYSTPTQYAMKLRGEYTPEGVAKANFKQKDGRVRMSVKGKGKFIRARSVPGSGAVNLVAQLLSSEGICWEITYQQQDVLKNDGTRYIARRR